MADLANEEKPAVAPSVFVFQKDKGQKRSAGSSSPEAGEDSDHEDGNYCPPIKRERTSSLTHSEEKSSGFRLKPPTLIHGQAPSAGLPSQKPREQQRGVLRPAVLQAPQPKVLSQTGKGLSHSLKYRGKRTLWASPILRKTSIEE